MEVNTLLSTIILVSFIATVVLAVGSYLAYKIRERRRPRAEHVTPSDDPVYFERFLLPRAEERPASGEGERAA